jgi:putative isomerase
MARTLGKAPEAEVWDQKAGSLRELIRKHQWNKDLGIYNDTKPNGNPSALITPVIFWPLWTGVSTPEQARGVLPFLKDPKGLATPWPLPSVAVNSPAYRPGEFWRGGTWINLNWVAIRGLQRYGFADEAKALRERTLELIALTPVLYELYDSQSGAPVGSPHYGWTSALYIDLVMRPEVDSLRDQTE